MSFLFTRVSLRVLLRVSGSGLLASVRVQVCWERVPAWKSGLSGLGVLFGWVGTQV